MHASSPFDATVSPARPTAALVAVLTDPDSITTCLTGVGIAPEPPAIAPARPLPQPGAVTRSPVKIRAFSHPRRAPTAPAVLP